MKKLWIQTISEGSRYLVGAGKIRCDVSARDKPEALQRAKQKLSSADRYVIGMAPRRIDR